MKLRLDRKQIRRLVQQIGRIINGRSKHLPVIGHVKVEARTGNSATFTATDLDQSLEISLGDVVVTPDHRPFLVPLTELRQLGKDMRAGCRAILQSNDTGVTLSLEENGETISRAISTMPVEDFPAVFREIDVAAYPVRLLLETYTKVERFASTEPDREMLNSVFFHAQPCCLVATDGRRACRFPIPQAPFVGDVILPRSKFLTGFVPDDSDEGATGMLEHEGKQTVEIRSGNVRWQGLCREGIYPNYRQVIPDAASPWDARFTVAPSDVSFLETIVAQFCTHESEEIHLGLAGGRVVVLGRKNEEGRIPSVVLPSSTSESEEPLLQSINGAYFLDGLRCGFTDIRLCRLAAPWRCIRPGDPVVDAEREPVHVVMPLRDEPTEELLGIAVEAVAKRLDAPAPATVSPIENSVQPTPASATEHPPKEIRKVKTVPAAIPSAASTVEPAVPTDPVDAFRDAFEEADAAVRQSAAKLRSLKARFRRLEKELKAREKRYAQWDKAISTLQQAAGF